MNTGQRTIDWLCREQLRVDETWSVRNSEGFTWWADRHAQRVEVIGSEAGPDGSDGYFVRVKTEFIRDVALNEKALAGINLLMSTATMAGPVYDGKSKVLSLSSLVRVHEGIREWISPLISVAAMLQIADAHFLSSSMSQLVGGMPAESGHPTNGLRAGPDELAVGFTPMVAAAGAKPSSWSATEFKQAVDQYMRGPPVLLATSGGEGLTAEFAYGERSSLCEMKGDVPHPRIGHGLLVVQSFPVEPMADAAGVRLALELNAEELHHRPAGYGFGSYCYRDGCIRFNGFIPNAAYRHGLLPNLYFACAGRARVMSSRFMGDDWSSASGRRSEPAIAAVHSALDSTPRDRVIPCGACGGTGRLKGANRTGWFGSLVGTKPTLEKCLRCGGTGSARS